MAQYGKSKVRKGTPPQYPGVMDVSNGNVQTRPRNMSTVLNYNRQGGTANWLYRRDPIPPGGGPPDVGSTMWYRAARGNVASCEKAYLAAEATAYNRITSIVAGESRAALGQTFAEWRQSTTMISTRVGTAIQLFSAARRRNPQAFFDALGLKSTRLRNSKQNPLTVSRSLKSFSKDAANMALELKFGWAPLAQDIQNGIKSIARDFPPLKIFGSGSSTATWDDRDESWPYYVHSIGSAELGASYTCHLKRVNPNTLLANSLGLINPPSVAWETIPLSFVVNWFLPIGTFLDSFTGLCGVDLMNCSRTRRGKASGTSTWRGGHPISGDLIFITGGDGFYFAREAITAPPVPSLKAQYYANSAVRNARDAVSKITTLVELLTQRQKF